MFVIFYARLHPVTYSNSPVEYSVIIMSAIFFSYIACFLLFQDSIMI